METYTTWFAKIAKIPNVTAKFPGTFPPGVKNA